MPPQPARGRFRCPGCGLSNVWLAELDYHTCPLCGMVEHAIPELRSLTRRLVETLIFKRTLLRGEEVRFLRGQLSMSPDDLGLLLCVMPEAIAGMETGFHPIGPLHDLTLRLMAAQQCLRWCYPLHCVREIDPSRAEATTILLRLHGRRWQVVGG